MWKDLPNILLIAKNNLRIIHYNTEIKKKNQCPMFSIVTYSICMQMCRKRSRMILKPKLSMLFLRRRGMDLDC